MINQLLLKVNQKNLNPNLINTKKKLLLFLKKHKIIRPDLNKIDSIINNCVRDCYNKYFHTFENTCIYDIDTVNGDFVSGVISDKMGKEILREHGFLHKLTTKFIHIDDV